MKQSLIVLTSLLVLSACGGGDSGSVPAPIDIRNSNLTISSNIDNETRRTAHVANALGNDYYNNVDNEAKTSPETRGATMRDHDDNICKSARDCNDIAFNNMKQWLIDNIDSFDDWDDNQKLRQALKMAGFGSVLAGNWDDIKEWANNNKNMIQNKAQEIYDELGSHQDFDITQSDFTVLDNSGTDTTKLKFLVNDDEKITDIIVQEEHGTPYETEIHGIRDNDTANFHVGGQTYEYTLTNIAPQYDPDSNGTQSISFESPVELTLEQIQDKLTEIADYEISLGEDGFFGRFHNNCTPEDVYNVLIEQINSLTDAWENLSMESSSSDYVFNVDSYGKQVGLAYSDFGMLHVISSSDDIDPDQTYHGGYNANRVETEHLNNINNTMTFNGRATGRVLNAQYQNHVEDAPHTYHIMYVGGDAHLVFEGGEHRVETLQMAFADWYDVNVTRNDGNTENATITFNNYTNQSDDAEFYKFRIPGQENGRDEYAPEFFVGGHNIDTNNNGITGPQEGCLSIEYFATTPSSNPAEVSGYVAYSEGEPGFGNDPEVDMINRLEFQAAFGAIRQY